MKTLRLLRTVSYLKWSQILSRLLKRITPKQLIKFRLPSYTVSTITTIKKPSIQWPHTTPSVSDTHIEYTFINQTLQVPHDTWFPKDASRLWLYNLHYFNTIHTIPSSQALHLIKSWIKHVPLGTPDAWHPYTTSLRVTNWIYWISENKHTLDIPTKKHLLNSLWKQVFYIRYNLEKDVLGNHYLENLRALILGAIFFNHTTLLKFSKKQLETQLKEQFLADGGHYERSPMYHCLMLELLASIHDALKQTNKIIPKALQTTLSKATHFLEAITHNNTLPHFNDSTDGIAPDPAAILNFIFNTTHITPSIEAPNFLPHFGLWSYKSDTLSVVMDVGKIGPDFLTAHAHNDFLSYELTHNNIPIVTDSGIYDYESGKPVNWRHTFRSTASHNTIMINNQEQNEIWSHFRTGYRGTPTVHTTSKTQVTASHNAYKKLGITHTRTLSTLEKRNAITVRDTLTSKSPSPFTANNFIHLAPQLKLTNQATHPHKSRLTFESDNNTVIITVYGSQSVDVTTSWFSSSFNIKEERASVVLSGKFSKSTECKYCIYVLPK